MKPITDFLMRQIYKACGWAADAPWGDYLQVGFFAFVIFIIVVNALFGGGENNSYGY